MRAPLTSLPLQIFIFFGGWWDIMFWLISIAVFIYKGAAAAGAVQCGNRALHARGHAGRDWRALTSLRHACPASPVRRCMPGMTLPYPEGRYAAEFVFLWLWLLMEPARLFLGTCAPHAAVGSAAG